MNQAEIKLHSVQEAPALFHRLYGRLFAFDDMVELLPVFLRNVGGIAVVEYFAQLETDCGKAELPCKAEELLGVADARPLDIYGYTLDENLLKDSILNYTPSDVHGVSRPEDFQKPKKECFWAMAKPQVTGQLRGRYLDYKLVDDCIHLALPSPKIDVIFNAIAQDSEGLPMLREKALYAFIEFLNYMEVRKEFYQGRTDGQRLQLAQQTYEQKAAAARTPAAVSLNQLDRLIRARNSMQRTTSRTNWRL